MEHAGAQIQGIIFDLGGVLLAPMGDIIYEKTAALLGVSQSQAREAIWVHAPALQKGDITLAEFGKRICDELNVAHPQSNALEKMWDDIFSKLEVMQPVVDIACRLGERFPLGIISNTEQAALPYLKKLPFLHCFDAVILSPEVGICKPEREIFELAAKRLNLSLNELLFIDDDPRWTEAAQRYGLKTIRFQSAKQFIAELTAMGIMFP